ncbi:MAG: four helix bundle protein [Verrucomicrobiota bacterium]
MMKEQKYDLEDRFVAFAVRIINLSETLPKTKAGNHVCTQILKSGTSPAPNYGEAQGAESPNDFVHKLKIALKELRETRIWLKIISKARMIQPETVLDSLLQETDELIAITFTSIDTAKNNRNRKKGMQ